MQDEYARKLEDQKSLFRQLGIKLDALSIHEKDFDAKMRGYDKEEVDRFLDDIIVDYERFYDIITDLLDKYKEIQRRQAYWEEEKKALATRKPQFDLEMRWTAGWWRTAFVKWNEAWSSLSCISAASGNPKEPNRTMERRFGSLHMEDG